MNIQNKNKENLKTVLGDIIDERIVSKTLATTKYGIIKKNRNKLILVLLKEAALKRKKIEFQLLNKWFDIILFLPLLPITVLMKKEIFSYRDRSLPFFNKERIEDSSFVEVWYENENHLSCGIQNDYSNIIIKNSEKTYQNLENHILRFRKKIDIVYTWVDGNDKNWMSKKSQYEKINQLHSANDPSRYTSRDELKYSLRSLEMYANFYNNIYIVTDSQVPKWLNTKHNKIKVIDHKTIFKDKTNLPTFNSHAIESNLHNIPNLSEHFIYMNDDFFFTKTTQPELFFKSNGLTSGFLSKNTYPNRMIIKLPIDYAGENTKNIIKKYYELEITHKIMHAPYALKRSTLKEIEDLLNDQIEITRSNRFRSTDDISLTSSLYFYYSYCRSQSIFENIKTRYVDLSHIAHPLAIITSYLEDNQFICLNETIFKHQNSRIIQYFLKKRFPYKSEFEI